MREDVMSLKAMGGDPVSEEYLKADLYHRAEALKDIPDAPLFFGRLDYASQHGASRHGASQPGPANTGPANTGPANTGQLRRIRTAWNRTARNWKFRNWNIRNGQPTMASRGTAFTSAEGTCTRRTARPP